MRADFLVPFVSVFWVLKNNGCCLELVVVNSGSSEVFSVVFGLVILFSGLLIIGILGLVNTFWKPFAVGKVLFIVEAMGNKASGEH